jgi:hypothetical protein
MVTLAAIDAEFLAFYQGNQTSGETVSDYTKIKATNQQIVDTIRAVAAEQPDRVYTSPELDNTCLYVHRDYDGNMVPGCIVGVALNRLGVPLSELANLERHTARSVIAELVDRPYTDYSGMAEAWITHVQRRQDGVLLDIDDTIENDRYTWGAAVAEANERYPL